VTSFLIETNDNQKYFASFLELGRSQPVVLTESNGTILGSLSKELGKMEMYERILGFMEGELSIENVVR
jgi:hypothetical protein